MLGEEDKKDLVPVNNEIVDAVMSSSDKDELQTQLELFNINQAKKNVIRIAKLNNVIDLVDDQLLERIKKRPDQISTSDLSKLMDVLSNQIDRANKFNTDIINAAKPTIKAVNTEINVNVTPQLTREEKTDVMEAVAELIKQIKNKSTENVVAFPNITNTEEKTEFVVDYSENAETLN